VFNAEPDRSLMDAVVFGPAAAASGQVFLKLF
jgi:hypothetical protein